MIALRYAFPPSPFSEGLANPNGPAPTQSPDGEKAYSSREWGWSDGETYMIRAVVDKAQQVEAFSVTTLSEDFQPPLSYLAEAAGQPLWLGLTTFAELSAAFDQELSPAGRDAAGIAANGRWYYSEYYSIPNPLYRTFTASYGFTGSGFTLDGTDDPRPVLDAIEDCEPQPCLGAVHDMKEVDRARSAWPITTFTVLGDIGNVPRHLQVLTAEPLDDDIEAADR